MALQASPRKGPPWLLITAVILVLAAGGVMVAVAYTMLLS
jgi:hypothetical protein